MHMMMMMFFFSSDDSMASLDPDDPNAAFSLAYLSTEAVSLAMNTIKSSHTTTNEHLYW